MAAVKFAAAVKVAFAHLVLDEVISIINPANQRSRAIAERLGSAVYCGRREL